MPYILPVEMQYKNAYGKRALPPESIVLDKSGKPHYYRVTSDKQWRNDCDAYRRYLDKGGQNDVHNPAPMPADHVRFEVPGEPDWHCITLGAY